ncbi:MAG: hypothetical protein V4773_29935 [Verrucomicrobiota bacterium]
MSKPRLLLLSLALAGVAGVGVGLGWNSKEHDGASVAPSLPGSAPRVALPAPAARLAEQTVYFDSVPAPLVSREQMARPAIALGADASGALAEQAALQQLAREADLELSPRQLAGFAVATAYIQAVRQTYEASLATVKPLESGGYRMEIPAYAAAGDALREKFKAELRTHVGPNTADEILTLLGGKLEGYFGGFGVSVQTLDFTATAGAAGVVGAGGSASAANDFQVTRTVQYWNAREGGTQLNTRRETHFPGLEDPSGETWGAFLARLPAGVQAPGRGRG